MNQFIHPEISLFRKICALAMLAFFPVNLIIVVSSAMLSTKIYSPHWECDIIYTPWYEKLCDALEFFFFYPLCYPIWVPAVLAGFMLLRSKSNWFAVLAVPVVCWSGFLLIVLCIVALSYMF